MRGITGNGLRVMDKATDAMSLMEELSHHEGHEEHEELHGVRDMDDGIDRLSSLSDSFVVREPCRHFKTGGLRRCVCGLC